MRDFNGDGLTDDLETEAVEKLLRRHSEITAEKEREEADFLALQVSSVATLLHHREKLIEQGRLAPQFALKASPGTNVPAGERRSEHADPEKPSRWTVILVPGWQPRIFVALVVLIGFAAGYLLSERRKTTLPPNYIGVSTSRPRIVGPDDAWTRPQTRDRSEEFLPELDVARKAGRSFLAIPTKWLGTGQDRWMFILPGGYPSSSAVVLPEGSEEEFQVNAAQFAMASLTIRGIELDPAITRASDARNRINLATAQARESPPSFERDTSYYAARGYLPRLARGYSSYYESEAMRRFPELRSSRRAHRSLRFFARLDKTLPAWDFPRRFIYDQPSPSLVRPYARNSQTALGKHVERLAEKKLTKFPKHVLRLHPKRSGKAVKPPPSQVKPLPSPSRSTPNDAKKPSPRQNPKLTDERQSN